MPTTSRASHPEAITRMYLNEAGMAEKGQQKDERVLTQAHLSAEDKQEAKSAYYTGGGSVSS